MQLDHLERAARAVLMGACFDRLVPAVPTNVPGDLGRDRLLLFLPAQEWHFDRALEQAEEGLFGRLLTTDSFHWVATKRTKQMGFSAPPPEPMNTGIAHHFTTPRALMRDARLLVAGTDHRAIFQHHRRRRSRPFVLRNGHLDLSGFHQ